MKNIGTIIQMFLNIDRTKEKIVGEMMKKAKKTVVYAVIAFGFTLLSAVLSTLFTDTTQAWYLALQKSPLQPPGILFPIIWAVLYILLGVSFFIVLLKSQGKKDRLFLLNGLLLPLWTYLFFMQKNPGAALIVLLGIFGVSIFLFFRSSKTSKIAGNLLIPYVLWIGFAIVLNYSIVLLNELK